MTVYKFKSMRSNVPITGNIVWKTAPNTWRTMGEAALCKKQFAFGEHRVDYDSSTSTVVIACAAEVDHGVNLFDDC